tara:strand:+ start:1478 stop:1987 length:510 start_codon:yes stop_codon:yes gene_type:complete
MTWFDILKDSELVQSQRQGMKPIDIQKPFKRVKEDKSDCYDEFVRIYEKTKNSFPNARKTKVDNNTKEYFYFDKTMISLSGEIPQRGEIPDEVFCETIKLYKSIEDLASGKTLENHYIEVAKYNDMHYMAIWKGDYSEGVADAYIQIVVDVFGGKSLNQNIGLWRGSFI